MRSRKLIAFDNSALERLWGAPSSIKIIRQAAGVREVLTRIRAGEHQFLLTDALMYEIDQTPNVDRRAVAFAALPEHSNYAADHDGLTTLIATPARAKLRSLDALHVALAWEGRADLLFTTDVGIVRFAKRHSGVTPGLTILDPLDWNEVL